MSSSPSPPLPPPPPPPPETKSPLFFAFIGCIAVLVMVIAVVAVCCLRCRRRDAKQESSEAQRLYDPRTQAAAVESRLTFPTQPVLPDDSPEDCAALLKSLFTPTTESRQVAILKHPRFVAQFRSPEGRFCASFERTRAIDDVSYPKQYVTLVPAALDDSVTAFLKTSRDWVGNYVRAEVIQQQHVVFTSSDAIPLSRIAASSLNDNDIKTMFEEFARRIHSLFIEARLCYAPFKIDLLGASQQLNVLGVTYVQKKPLLQLMFPSCLIPATDGDDVRVGLHFVATALPQWLPCDHALSDYAASICAASWACPASSAKPVETIWHGQQHANELHTVRRALRNIAAKACKHGSARTAFLYARAYANFLATAQPLDNVGPAISGRGNSLAESRSGFGGFDATNTVLESGLCGLYSIAFSAAMIRGLNNRNDNWGNAIRLESDIRAELFKMRACQTLASMQVDSQPLPLLLPSGELNVTLLLKTAGQRETGTSPLTMLLSAVNITPNVTRIRQLVQQDSRSFNNAELSMENLKFGDLLIVNQRQEADGLVHGHLVCFVKMARIASLSNSALFLVFDSAILGNWTSFVHLPSWKRTVTGGRLWLMQKKA